jgi:hypothetical protein
VQQLIDAICLVDTGTVFGRRMEITKPIDILGEWQGKKNPKRVRWGEVVKRGRT